MGDEHSRGRTNVVYDEAQVQVDDESFHEPHVPGCVWVEELSAQRAGVVGVLPDVIQRHIGGNALRWVEPPMDAARQLRSRRLPPDAGRAVAWTVKVGLVVSNVPRGEA